MNFLDLLCESDAYITKFMDALGTSDRKYKDIKKVKVSATPKGNWRVYYDGKDTGVTLSGSLLPDKTVEKYGLEYHMDESVNIYESNSKMAELYHFLVSELHKHKGGQHIFIGNLKSIAWMTVTKNEPKIHIGKITKGGDGTLYFGDTIIKKDGSEKKLGKTYSIDMKELKELTVVMFK